MGRFFGGKKGVVSNASADVSNQRGIFSMFDQYYSRRRGGWAIPGTSGGDQQLVVGSYTVELFDSPGTLTVNRSINVDIFLIGGGGAGGRSYGDNDTGKGGGGAGQGLWRQNIPLGAGTYAITVGAGGVGRNTPESGNNTYGQGNHGATSSIVLPAPFGGTVTARGGFGGAGSDGNGPYTATGYGCGGGGGARNASSPTRHNGITGGQNTYSGWTSYTSNGGNSGDSNLSGGGGGGCGANGSNQSGSSNDSNSAGGAGGAGVDMSTYFGTAVGDSGWFGGGGGGGSYRYNGPITYRAAGGQGGGGKGNTAQETSQGGSFDNTNIDAQANTGGGGGGSSEGPNNGGSHSGYGGSGIVLIRYPTQ